MTRNLRRNAALLALPFVLSVGLAGCGDSSATDKADQPAPSTAASSPTPPSIGDIPDPRKDPKGFQAYLTDMYKKSGLSEAQASCMSKAYMDNVDVTKLDDEAAITAAMNNDKLNKAVVDCMK